MQNLLFVSVFFKMAKVNNDNFILNLTKMLQVKRKYKNKKPPKYRGKKGEKKYSTKGRIRKYDKKSLQGRY